MDCGVRAARRGSKAKNYPSKNKTAKTTRMGSGAAGDKNLGGISGWRANADAESECDIPAYSLTLLEGFRSLLSSKVFADHFARGSCRKRLKLLAQ
jgi:hypothetical protein